ncbi:MAG: hypothetical protein WCJ19_00540 [bacterium]
MKKIDKVINILTIILTFTLIVLIIVFSIISVNRPICSEFCNGDEYLYLVFIAGFINAVILFPLVLLQIVHFIKSMVVKKVA